MMAEKKKYFFGWTNIKRFIMEIIYTMSNKRSFLSKKRVQEWMIFLTAYITSIIWFFYHFKTMDVGVLVTYMCTLLAYAGFQTIQIQREKRKNDEEEII